MKQLTMTKVLTPLAALAFAFGAQAAIVPAETFDSYTAGTTVITNQTGWSFTYGTDGADDASAVTAYDNNAPAQNIVPDGQTAGANYLKLSTEDGTLFRNMRTDGGTLDLNAGLFVDTDVQFTVTDASDSPTNTVSADDKLVIWLEANGATTNLCVLGHSFGASTSDRTDKVYTLVPAAGGTLSITPGDWYRLTVKAVSSFSLADESVSYPAFQVYLNGAALKADEYIGDATTLEIGQITDYQPYIPARTATMTSLTKVGFSGEGALDSVVVTRDVPECAGGVAVTITWDTTILDYVEVKTADGLNAFGETLNTSPVTVKVSPNTQFKLVPTYKSGYSASTHAVNYTAGVGSAAVDATGVVTVAAAGAVDITTTARDTVKVSFDFENLMTSIGAAMSSDFVSAVFSINGVTAKTVTTLTWDELVDEDTAGTFSFEGLKLGTNITIEVTYAQDSGWTTEVAETSDTACLTRSSYTFTVTSLPEGRAATVAVGAFKPGATVDGDPVRTFADALTAALAKGTATITLAGNATVGDAEIAADKNITIDLAGNTITGAAEAAAVFSVAANGALTITNSTGIGYVNAGSATKCIVNAGALNIQGGNFGGTIEGGATVTGGFFNQALANAVCPTGQEIGALASGYEDASYAYGLKNSSYAIQYYYGEDLLNLVPASYTYGTAETLPETAGTVTGKTFAGWYDNSGLEGDPVTTIAAGTTGAQTFYAKYTDNTYTIKFVYGLNGETTNTQSLAYGATPTAPTTAANVTGYTWAWDTTPVDVVADATYTAVYTAATYDVKYYDINNDEIVASATTYTYGTGLAELASAPEVSGKTFDGWFATSARTGDAVTSIGTTETGAKAFYAKYSDDAPAQPTIDPNSGDTVAGVEAETAQEATAQVKVAQPAASKTSAGEVTEVTYQGYFKKTATETSTGVWTVKAELDPDVVVKPATTAAAAIVSGTAASGTVTVPQGLYYKITTMTGLDGTGSSKPQEGWSDGSGITVSKPGSSQGFIKVQIGADVIE